MMEDPNEHTAEGSYKVTFTTHAEEEAQRPSSNTVATYFNDMSDDDSAGVSADRLAGQRTMHLAVYQWHLCTFALTSI